MLDFFRRSNISLLLYVFALSSLSLIEAKHSEEKNCGTFHCTPGQQCVEINPKQYECVCRIACKKHNRPVCGSDGVTYPNHCELHRTACVEERKIRILHKNKCAEEANQDKVSKDVKMHKPHQNRPHQKGHKVHKLNPHRKDLKAHKSRPQHPHRKDDQIPKLEKNENGILKPLVCFQVERDALHRLIIDWFKKKTNQKEWRNSDKGYKEMLDHQFNACDRNVDHKLDPDELLQCTEKNITMKNHRPYHISELHILRGLCIDALVTMCDDNGDWFLNPKEFKKCLALDFVPPTKECSLEGRLYKDGAETKVSCNTCICACGNWVCTGTQCPEKDGVPEFFLPGKIKMGHLPSRKERRILLKGFEASKVIPISRVEKEIELLSSKEEQTMQQVEHFVQQLKHKVMKHERKQRQNEMKKNEHHRFGSRLGQHHHKN